MIAKTPVPPYYAVIFTSVKTATATGYLVFPYELKVFFKNLGLTFYWNEKFGLKKMSKEFLL